MTPKMRAFAQSYARHESCQKAALEAGYSKHYAATIASKLLDHKDVIAEIKRLRARLNEQADKSAADVVNEFAKIAFADRLGFLKEDPLNEGEFIYKAPNELSQDQRDVVENTKMNIVELEIIGEDGTPTRVQRQEYVYLFAEKAKALEQMGRHFGIFDDKLRLGAPSQNPFRDASPEQLNQLKAAFVKTMGKPALIESADYKEVEK